MTKQEFIKTFGEDPVDVIGQDWENDLDGATDAEITEFVRIERSDDGE